MLYVNFQTQTVSSDLLYGCVAVGSFWDAGMLEYNGIVLGSWKELREDEAFKVTFST